MDKASIGFLTDVLYIKGFICWEEYEDIMGARNVVDLERITEKMLREEYSPYKRGEGYVRQAGE